MPTRTGFGTGGLLSLASPFGDLVQLWLTDLELRDIADNTKDNYRDDLRLHVLPFFEHYTLGEVTTGRVEWFLKSERAVSYSRAKHSRTVLNQLFAFALRHDALPRNPVEGTSRCPGRSTRSTRSPLTRCRRSGPRRLPGAPDPGWWGRAPTGRSATRSRCCWAPRCSPARRSPCAAATSSTAPGGWWPMFAAPWCTGRAAAPSAKTIPRLTPPSGRSRCRSSRPRCCAVAIARVPPGERQRTIFANRAGGPLSEHNFRRTFREFLVLTGLADSGISPRWYRRTGATVLARGLGIDVATAHLGHTSKAITEGYYIEPDRSIDFTPARVLEATLRPRDPDGALLARPETDEEDRLLDTIDPSDRDDSAGPA